MKTQTTERPRPLRVVVWTAVSSEEQARDEKISLEEQEQLGRAWAAEKGGIVVAHLTVPGHPRSESDLLDALEELRRKGVTAYDDLRALWKSQAFDVLWAYSHSRLGRARTILPHVIDNVIKSGAIIVLRHGGTIERSNVDIQLAMGNMTAVTDLERFVESSMAGKRRLAEKGIPTTSKPILSHKIIRDERGKAVAYVPDPTKKRLIEDAAQLFIEGTGWDHFEDKLFERFGHGRDGRPYGYNTFYNLFHNPWFWGHGAIGYKTKTKRNGQQSDLWAFDENFPLPEGVSIFRNTHEPALTGELANAVQAEMRRRRHVIRGSMRPRHSYPFSGLILCAYCGYTMCYSKSSWKDRDVSFYRCRSKYTPGIMRRCDRFRKVRITDAQVAVNEFLERMLAADTPFIFDSATPDYESRAQVIREEIATLEANIRRLIAKQASAPDNLSSLYDEQLAQMSTQLAILKRNLADTMQVMSRQDRIASQRALEEIKQFDNLESFWRLEPTRINQILLQLFGNRRLVAKDGEITHTVEVS